MNLIKSTAVLALLSGVANAQGLFDINPNEIESESSPLQYSASLNYGYDDNTTPTAPGDEIGSSYVGASATANIVVRDAKTSWDLNALIGTSYYFDEGVPNDNVYNTRFAINFNHRISERLRFVSRNFFNYGLDLGSFFGEVTSRANEEYTYFSTDNSIGYEWTERLGTYTGISVSLLNYDEAGRDVYSLGLNHQFRYVFDELTTLTASMGYSFADFDDDDSSGRLTTSVGFERKLNDVSSFGAQIGAQFSEANSPYGALNYNYQVSSKLRARAFARYSLEDTDTVFAGGRYEDKAALRIGAAAEYELSPKASLTIGANTALAGYAQGGVLADGDWDLFNIYTSLSYSLTNSASLSASVYHSSSSSTDAITNKDYDSNRYQLGVSYAF